MSIIALTETDQDNVVLLVREDGALLHCDSHSPNDAVSSRLFQGASATSIVAAATVYVERAQARCMTLLSHHPAADPPFSLDILNQASSLEPLCSFTAAAVARKHVVILDGPMVLMPAEHGGVLLGCVTNDGQWEQRTIGDHRVGPSIPLTALVSPPGAALVRDQSGLWVLETEASPESP